MEAYRIATDELPSHSHNYWLDTNKNGSTTSNGFWFVDAGSKGTTQDTWVRTTEPTGGNQPHNNMPPYYTLAYIMKL